MLKYFRRWYVDLVLGIYFFFLACNTLIFIRYTYTDSFYPTSILTTASKNFWQENIIPSILTPVEFGNLIQRYSFMFIFFFISDDV